MSADVHITSEALTVLVAMRDAVAEVGHQFGTTSTEYLNASATLARSLSTMLTMHQLTRVMADGPLSLYCQAFISFGVNVSMRDVPTGFGHSIAVPTWSVNS